MTANLAEATCKICKVMLRPGQGLVVPPAWEVRCQEHAEAKPVARKRKVMLALAEGYVTANPAFGPTSEDLFEIRVAARTVGGIQDISGAWKVNPGFAIALQGKLEKEGFEPILSPALAAFLQARDERSKQDRLQADERLAKFEAECDTRGLRLMEYQRTAVKWLAPLTAGLLGDPFGSGKTPMALMSLPERAAVVVVCPASVKGVWLNEVKKWRPDLHPDLAINTTFTWPTPGHVVIVNYEGTKKPERIDALGTPTHGTVLIADEAQRLMNPGAQLTIRFKYIQKRLAMHGGRTWLVTATPIKGKPDELYRLLEAAGLEGVFGTISHYRGLFNAHKVYHTWVWGEPSPEVANRLKGVMLRRKKEDILAQLPPLTIQDVPVAVWAEVHLECDKAEKLLAELGISLEDAMSLSFKNKSQRLAFEELSRVYALLATAKVPAALELIEDLESQDEPVIVFSAHKAPIVALETRAGWRAIYGDITPAERTRIVADMQAGVLRGIAMTIQTGGLGLTLTRSCHAIFIDLDWTPDNNKQAEARVLRIGQGRPVLIKRLIADHTLDRRMLEIHKTKMKLFEQTIDKATIPGVAPDSLPIGLVLPDQPGKPRKASKQIKTRKYEEKKLLGQATFVALEPKKVKKKAVKKKKLDELAPVNRGVTVEKVTITLNGHEMKIEPAIGSPAARNAAFGVSNWIDVAMVGGNVLKEGDRLSEGDELETRGRLEP